MSQSVEVVSLGQRRSQQRERNRRRGMSDRQRIEELEDQIRRLVDLVDDLVTENEQNRKIIRQILRGLTDRSRGGGGSTPTEA